MRGAGRSALAVFSSALAVAAWCGGCTEQAPPSEPLIRPVRYERVESTGLGRVRSFAGTARAGRRSHLSFRVSGSVRSVHVVVGETVEAGYVLAELDPKDYQLQVQEAEASLAQAQAEGRNAAANYERTRALYENRNASRNDLDAARAASESVQAAARSLENRLELARLQLSYTTLKAPVKGAIAAITTEVNENVQAGQAVVTLTSGSRPEVEIAVPEVLIAGLREGMPVSVRLAALPGRVFDAVVTEVGVAASGTATTFPVTVRLEQSNVGFRPGMAAEVRIVFGGEDDKDRILVPPVAVGEDRAGRFVFVVEPEGEDADDGVRLAVAHRRAVSVGELSERGLEIYSGLSEGEFLVTAGVRRIKDGQRVKLLPR